MGAWGVLAFDNDTANDWAYELESSRDLSLIDSALARVEAAGNNYLDADAASEALAACEVLARLKGRPGYSNAYTEKVDAWVENHAGEPPTELVARAEAVIDRILGENSELRDLWADSDIDAWKRSVDDLRQRLTA